MSDFTERLRRKAWDYDNTMELTDTINESADIIDSMEFTLRICQSAFEYLGVDENQTRLYAPAAVRETLAKLRSL